MKNILFKAKLIASMAILLLVGAGTTAYAVSDTAPTGGVPIESSLAVANGTSGDGKYHDSVNAKVDEVVKFEVWYHNPEPSGSNQIAQNVNVKIGIPNTKTKTHTATSSVGGSNTNTETDIATVNTEIDSNLEYIPGTAYRRHNTGTAQSPNWVTEKISDSVVSTGFVIPELKPCWEFQETITVQARVKASVFTVDKKVKIEGDSEWKKEITAKPGDKIAYLISFKNVSNTTLTKVLVRDSFPPKLDYVEGSAVLTTGTHPNGIPASDNLINGGTYIGDYTPGAAAYIRFNAIVPKELPQEGCYEFKNVVNIDTDQTDWFNNEAKVKSCFAKVTPPAPTPKPTVTPTAVTAGVSAPAQLPSSGPLEAAATAAATMSLSGGTIAWARSKKKLMSALRK